MPLGVLLRAALEVVLGEVGWSRLRLVHAATLGATWPIGTSGDHDSSHRTQS